MTSFKLAATNIKKSFKDYLVYFLSIVFSSMVFYVFISLYHNKQVREMLPGGVNTIFKIFATVVVVFISVFMWYSNSFFIKRRKKEIATYSLLGMKKRSISTMMVFENLFMGLLAIAFGIAIGTLFSKLFVMILVNLMKDTIEVKFDIAIEAILDTLKVFGIILLLTSLHGYSIIYRFKLITLFRAEKEGEKEPKASWIISIISLVLIMAGYYLAYTRTGIEAVLYALPILVIVVIGTYGIFRGLLIKIIKLFRRNKSSYYKGTNMIAASQMIYRIKGNATTLATIAVLSATTLTAMGSIYGLYSYSEDISRQSQPFSIAYKEKDPEFDNIIKATISKYDKHSIKSEDTVEFAIFQAKIELKDKDGLFKSPNVSIDSFSDSFIISESKYREVAKHQGTQLLPELKNENETLMIEMNIGSGSKGQLKNQKVCLKLPEGEMNLTIVDSAVKYLVPVEHTGTTFIVKDTVYSKLCSYSPQKHIIKGFMIENDKDSKQLSDELLNYSTKESLISMFYPNYFEVLRYFGMLLFIGVFMGFVFLLATGSIIYFKQMTDATEQKYRYKILRDIGMHKKEIKACVAKQLKLIFGLPLIVGILHSLFALSMLSELIQIDFARTVIMTVVLYSAIYIGYYFLTLNSYVKAVTLTR